MKSSHASTSHLHPILIFYLIWPLVNLQTEGSRDPSGTRVEFY
uniref:Uncharacterized protein n=1 Tax=Strigamia maritima TaxID=126957 RepID=T1JMA2_STRMM